MEDEYSPPTPEPQAEDAVQTPGLIEAFLVDPKGHASATLDPLSADVLKGGYLWLHLDILDAEDLVNHRLGLDPVVARSLLAPETRPRTQHLEGGILINLRGVNFNEGCRREDMLSLRAWLEQDRLITARFRRSLAVEKIRDRYRQGQGDRSPGVLMVEIIRSLLDFMDPVMDELADGVDAFEDKAITDGDDDELLDEVSRARHDAMIYRRYMAPMRDAISRLTIKQDDCPVTYDVEEMREEANRAMRIVEELDITTERTRVLSDQMAAARSEKMNRNMMLLSIVSAVFLPLSFLTGLLGVNVGGIPGTENPQGFVIVILICAFLTLGAGAFFKIRGWF